DAAVRGVAHAVGGDVPVREVDELAGTRDPDRLLDPLVVVVGVVLVGDAEAGRRHPVLLVLQRHHVWAAAGPEVDDAAARAGGRAALAHADRDALGHVPAVDAADQLA